MTARRAGWIGGTIVAVCAVAHAVAVALLSTTSLDVDDYASLPVLLSFPLIGAIIVSRQPRNAIGWILVITGASIALGLVGGASVDATLGPNPSYWQQVVGWWTNIAFIGGFEGLILSLVFLFPTGRTLSPHWRRAAQIVALLFVGSFVVLALKPGPLNGYFSDAPHLTNPFGVSWVGTLTDRLGVTGIPIGLAVVLIALLAIIARVRQSRGVERLQVQWFALVICVVGIALIANVIASMLLSDRWSVLVGLIEALFFGTAVLGIPTAIGIAILRYRLYDLDRLVSRGLLYLTLSAALVLVYFGLVLLLGAALRTVSGQSSGLVTAASTLISAALFRPLRSAFQRVIDRRFYRRRFDAERMAEGFAARLRDDVDLAGIRHDLRQVVMQTMQPEYVSLWLRPKDWKQR